MQTDFWYYTKVLIKKSSFSSKNTKTRWTKSRQISPAAVLLFELSLGGFHCSTSHVLLLLKAGGKPSTWFPPGGLVEQRKHADKHPTPTNKHNDKAREHPNEKQKWRSKTLKGQPRTQCTKGKQKKQRQCGTKTKPPKTKREQINEQTRKAKLNKKRQAKRKRDNTRPRQNTRLQIATSNQIQEVLR